MIDDLLSKRFGMSRVFLPSSFFFLFEKRRRKEGGEKKEWPRFDIRFFFHREESFQFKFNFGPDPLKIPRFWDTNLCSPPRSMKQKKRKKEASRNRTHSPFLYSAWYYEFCFSLLAGNVTFQQDEIHGLIQETLLLVLLDVDKFICCSSIEIYINILYVNIFETDWYLIKQCWLFTKEEIYRTRYY